ncbi:hypothetical protein IFM89_034720 [Coptis chinensis]|uniref:Uncharacterized protein n=1 Tax=Coptis chinensis TaxID=261450 RepID=A0A835HAK0_9MAGN|nr:hypothetical protein IFM89_034720 [Coptis chinensis]
MSASRNLLTRVASRTLSTRVVECMFSSASKSQDCMTLKHGSNHNQRVFGGKEASSCLPKGFRRSSAPSRYENAHTLSYLPCAPTNDSRKP